MRVNVSKASISKTFMYGLKVSLQRQLTKSNKKSLEFYLNLVKVINKQTLLLTATAAAKQFVALTILAEFATFATLLPTLLLNIFISFNVFSRLTVLMNDFRLKTFYNKASKSSKFIKTIKTSATSSSKSKTKTFSPTLTSAATIKLKLSATSITLSSSAAAAAFATSATLFKQTSSKNNHNRTYNNSSKSNKVFLYYTPRDPRLRIFLKTKHFSNRPQQQQKQQQQLSQLSKSKEYNNCCDKSLFKVLSDLCNYGELIGGGHKTSGEFNNSGDNQTIVKQLNNSANTTSYNNLNKTQTICDNTTTASDNLIVATAGAAIETTNSANILIANIIIVAVISEYYTRELFKSIEILLSFHQTHQELKIFNVKSSFGLYESIL